MEEPPARLRGGEEGARDRGRAQYGVGPIDPAAEAAGRGFERLCARTGT